MIFTDLNPIEGPETARRNRPGNRTPGRNRSKRNERGRPREANDDDERKLDENGERRQGESPGRRDCICVPHADSPDSPGASLETGRRVPGNRCGGRGFRSDGGGKRLPRRNRFRGFKHNQNDFSHPAFQLKLKPERNPKHNPEKERQKSKHSNSSQETRNPSLTQPRRKSYGRSQETQTAK